MTEDALKRAEAQTTGGDLPGAAATYRTILDRSPDDAVALDRLATIEERLGHKHRAAKLVERLVAVTPDAAAAHLKLATLRTAFGDHAAAQRHYGRAIALEPERAEAYSQLAASLFATHRFSDAETIAQQALLYAPDDGAVRFTLARALMAQGRLSEALGQLGQVLAQQPASAMAYVHLASCAEDPAEAAAGYLRALGLDPSLVPLHRLIGEATRRAEGDAASWPELRRAVERNPQDGEGWAELGAALMAADPQEAARCLDRALVIDGQHLGALVHRVVLHQNDGAFAAADAVFDRLVAALPERLQRERVWQTLADILYLDAYRPLPAERAEQVARQLDSVLAGRVNAFGRLAPRTRPAGRKIRLGYLSASFGDHPIGHVTVSLIPAHDRETFEVWGLSLRDRSAERQPFATRHRAGFDAFHDLSRLSPRTAAAAIADLDIDILVDLDGYVGRAAEILAYRPAPLQVVFIAHLDGINLSCADYLITDRVLVPPGEETLHREQIVRLPHTMHPADRHDIGPAPTRAAAGLPAKGVVFGAFSRADKLDPAIVAAWLRILVAVPGSVLWLAQPPTGTRLVASLGELARAAGVDPQRLVFAPRLDDKAAHLARLGLCDLFLDTPGFNAASTAIDALWAGVPVLALKGDRPGRRISASVLGTLGLSALVCESLDVYEAHAIGLAQAPDERAFVRVRLAEQRANAPLWDIDAFARGLEAAYAQMWRRYAAGEPPQGFELTATPDGPAPAPKPKPRTRRAKKAE